jgi:type III pantothenate kinase
MVESKLLIDLGNSRLKWVCARNGKIDKESAGSGDFESFSLLQSTVSGEGPGSVLVSSVAGSAGAQKVARFCETQWGVTADLLQSRAEQGGVRNGYQEPATLGVDRWLAIVGAVSRHGKPLVIWDLGTATTLDAVDDSGQHLGGLILPGPGTMLDSLTRDTKLMVPPVLQYAPPVPGLNTSEGIRGGVLAAQLGALNQFMRAVSERFQGEPSLIVTGGAAERLLVSLDFDYIHDPWLVFRGMLVD